jgi:hypothetical protein
MRIEVRIAIVPTKTETKHIPNKHLEHYFCVGIEFIPTCLWKFHVMLQLLIRYHILIVPLYHFFILLKKEVCIIKVEYISKTSQYKNPAMYDTNSFGTVRVSVDDDSVKVPR